MALAAKAVVNIGSRERVTDSSALSRVIDAVAQGFNLKPEDLKGRRRDKETSIARRVAMYLLRQENGCSLAQIGALLGDRDPSSVATGSKKLAEELVHNKSTKQKLADIKKILNSQAKNKTN